MSFLQKETDRFLGRVNLSRYGWGVIEVSKFSQTLTRGLAGYKKNLAALSTLFRHPRKNLRAYPVRCDTA